MRKNNLQKIGGLIMWSYTRNKSLIILCSIVQFFMAVALVYGYSLIIPDYSTEVKYYLASGAITIGIITIGCTISAQTISSDKQNGIINYLKTLPVKRQFILFSDLFIWMISSLLGIFISFIIVFLKFRLVPIISLANFSVILLILITMLSLGFAIAYCSSPNLMTLSTQLILMIGLLFSPILFPAERIPTIILNLYRFLPFVPSGDLIRNSIFYGQDISVTNVIILAAWLSICFFISLKCLSKLD